MMQRTKIVAEDSREAMARIMRECGEDAVILSTRKVAGGIEIIAGHSPKTGARRPFTFDEAPYRAEPTMAEKLAELREPARETRGRTFAEVLAESGRAEELLRPPGFEFRAARAPQPAPAPVPTPAPAATPATARPAFAGPAFAAALAAAPVTARSAAPITAAMVEAKPEPAPAPVPVVAEPAPVIPAAPTAPLVSPFDLSRLDAIETSIRDIRSMLGSELMMSGLKSAGASPALISVFLAQAETLASIAPDRRFSHFLARRMMSKTQPQLTGGPRIVMTLGPSGAGKTTLLAQLAARARMAAPDEKFTFINADSARFGATEQLRAYGRILDMSVIDIDQPSDVLKVMETSNQHVSLFIDMPSQPQDNVALLEVLEQQADKLPPMFRCGAIAANLSTDAVERILARYPDLDAVALTKLDEAPVSLSTFSLLSLRGPGVAYLASTSHLVKGLMEADSEMLESVVHASIAGSGSEPLN